MGDDWTLSANALNSLDSKEMKLTGSSIKKLFPRK
jgi:hypothetical protein